MKILDMNQTEQENWLVKLAADAITGKGNINVNMYLRSIGL